MGVWTGRALRRNGAFAHTVRCTALWFAVCVHGAAHASAQTLPGGWTASPAGAPAVRGSTALANGVFTVRGGGIDIWGRSDQFQFAYRAISGDVDIIARVTSLQAADDWSKAGVMVRASLAADSVHASLFTSDTHGIAFQRRPRRGGTSVHTAGGSGRTRVWLKLERRGSSVTGFRSSNGTTWTKIGSQALTLPSTFYVGLAVTAHASRGVATAAFTNVVTRTPSRGEPPAKNLPPSVSIVAPANGTTLVAPSSATISATASDADGTIARVEFLANGTRVGSDTSAPYSVSWPAAAAGTYVLTAVAVDNAGSRTTSAGRSIVVTTGTGRGRAVFNPSADHQTAVTRYRLDIFTAGANPETASPIATQDLGKPAVVLGECSVDIAALLNGLPNGTYVATIVAIGPAGTSPRAISAPFIR